MSASPRLCDEQSSSPFVDGLHRLTENPHLVDGTKLSTHQVDALEGTLTALLDNEQRLWFEHATGSGKTVAAMGFVDANPGKTLILTHRRSLVAQFQEELETRGYGVRVAAGDVTVQTYQWLLRHTEEVKEADYAIVICDEVHMALGAKTSAFIEEWQAPIWIGMTATGTLLAKSVDGLFPVQVSHFSLAQAAKRRVIVPLRNIRVAPGTSLASLSSVPLRVVGGEAEFDQESLAALLDHEPFNMAAADYYRATFGKMAGVVYAAGVEHAEHVAAAFCAVGLRAIAVSGKTTAKALAVTLAEYDAGKVDVLVNAQLLVEGWNAPRATVCMHLAPTASRRVYQQRIGRVTRRHRGKESGIVVDFVNPNTQHDNAVVSLHSLLDKDSYRQGATVVGFSHARRAKIKVRSQCIPISDQVSRRRYVIENQWQRVTVAQLTSEDKEVWIAAATKGITDSAYDLFLQQSSDEECGDFLLALLVNSDYRKRALVDIAKKAHPPTVLAALDWIDDQERDIQTRSAKSLLLVWSKTTVPSEWLWRVCAWIGVWSERSASNNWKGLPRALNALCSSTGQAHNKQLRNLLAECKKQAVPVQVTTLAALTTNSTDAQKILDNARSQCRVPSKRIAAILYATLPKNNQSHEKIYTSRKKTPQDPFSIQQLRKSATTSTHSKRQVLFADDRIKSTVAA